MVLSYYRNIYVFQLVNVFQVLFGDLLCFFPSETGASW